MDIHHPVNQYCPHALVDILLALHIGGLWNCSCFYLLHIGVDIFCILVAFVDVSYINRIAFWDFWKDNLVASRFKHLVFLWNRNLREKFVLWTSVSTRIFHKRVELGSLLSAYWCCPLKDTILLSWSVCWTLRTSVRSSRSFSRFYRLSFKW